MKKILVVLILIIASFYAKSQDCIISPDSTEWDCYSKDTIFGYVEYKVDNGTVFCEGILIKTWIVSQNGKYPIPIIGKVKLEEYIYVKSKYKYVYRENCTFRTFK